MMGLSFIIAADPRQRIHSRIRVPWDSRPYFTVPDSILHFLSPPTTRSATVEAFYPASTHLLKAVFRRLIREHLIEGLSLSFVMKTTKQHLRCAGNLCLCCCENKCFSSRYNGNDSVRCLRNDVSELSPLIRLSGIPSHCSFLKAVRPEYPNSVSPFLSFRGLCLQCLFFSALCFVLLGFFQVAVITLDHRHRSLLICARPERHPDTVRADPGELPSSST
jgi:hypothetical protein